ncbi:MAG: polysaccharide deacetylase family protein [Pseudomonadales bacterium]
MLKSSVFLKAPILVSDLLRARNVQPHLAILIYHQVLAQPDPLRPGVILQKQFVQQMALLRRHFHPISLREGVQRLKDGTLTPRCVCVTFDDGYADNLTVAAPVLAEYGIPATVFVASGFLDGGIMWNDRIIQAVGQARVDALDGSFLGVESLPTNTPEDKQHTIGTLLGGIKHRSMSERLVLVGELEKLLDASPRESPMLTTAQLRELARADIDIGAHTCNHPILSCEDDDTAHSEIVESKAELETLLQKSIDLFAYPNGRRGLDYDTRHVDMVERAGFTAAVSTDNGLNRQGGKSMQLHRFTPWDASPFKFCARLAGNEFMLKQQ